MLPIQEFMAHTKPRYGSSVVDAVVGCVAKLVAFADGAAPGSHAASVQAASFSGS